MSTTSNNVSQPAVVGSAEIAKSDEERQLPPVNVIGFARDAVGEDPLNGQSGAMVKLLKTVYGTSPAYADSAATALEIGSWRTQAERERLNALFVFGTLELNNFNQFNMRDQLELHAGYITNQKKARARETLVPSLKFSTDTLSNKSMIIDRPGYPGESFDIRALASRVSVCDRAQTTSLWRDLSRGLLSAILPDAVSQMFTASQKKKIYQSLPLSFISAIADCCEIASCLTAAAADQFRPKIECEVYAALYNRINEIREANIPLIVRMKAAIKCGFVPKGCKTREEACIKYGVNEAEVEIVPIGIPNPNMKRRLIFTQKRSVQDSVRKENAVHVKSGSVNGRDEKKEIIPLLLKGKDEERDRENQVDSREEEKDQKRDILKYMKSINAVNASAPKRKKKEPLPSDQKAEVILETPPTAKIRTRPLREVNSSAAPERRSFVENVDAFEDSDESDIDVEGMSESPSGSSIGKSPSSRFQSAMQAFDYETMEGDEDRFANLHRTSVVHQVPDPNIGMGIPPFYNYK